MYQEKKPETPLAAREYEIWGWRIFIPCGFHIVTLARSMPRKLLEVNILAGTFQNLTIVSNCNAS
jgi:hypothetical protein